MLKSSKLLAIAISIIFLFTSALPFNAAYAADTVKAFSDVPADNYFYKAVNDLRSLGVTDGTGNNKFGIGKPLTRGEFVTWLVKLTGLTLVSPQVGTFYDNLDRNKSYYKPIETALKYGIIQKTYKFRPTAYISRDEMAVMLIRYLGYDNIALKLAYLGKPYNDVVTNTGYITMIKDFGLMDPYNTLFKPDTNVLREQAALSLIRTYEKKKTPITSVNAFYAIQSNLQRDKISSLNSACFGWGRLTYDEKAGQVILNTKNDGTPYKEYYLPEGFSERIKSAKQAGIPAMLSIIAMQDVKVVDATSGSSIGIVEYVLTKPGAADKLINDISALLAKTELGTESESFDGVVIDFEGLRGTALKASFNSFLKKLKTRLTADKKKLYVTVQPLYASARSKTSIDGYDYKTIGSLADKIILMAHDYNARTLSDSDMARGVTDTPLTPLEDVYYALKAITDKNTGVQDRSRIMLQISFGWYGWQKKDGKTLNKKALSYSYENFLKLFSGAFTVNWSPNSRNPYLKYTDAATGIENTVWYEDSRSVQEKLDLAELFGIQQVSLWRLGQIPDIVSPVGSKQTYMNIWQTILNEKK